MLKSQSGCSISVLTPHWGRRELQGPLGLYGLWGGLDVGVQVTQESFTGHTFTGGNLCP